MIVEWNGTHVKAMRTAFRDTQIQFAERLGVSVPAICKWEGRGDTQTLLPKYAEMMDTAYSRLDVQQVRRFHDALALDGQPGFRRTFPAAPMISAATAEDDSAKAGDDVDRRQFGTAMVGLSALTIGNPSPTGKALARIGVSDAAQVQADADQFERDDQHVGGAALLRQAHRKLEQAKMIVETCEFTPQSGPAFMSATGNMASTVGWLAYDAENHPLARRCFADALSMANLADDDALTVQVCMNASLQSNRLARRGLGSAHHTLRLTERARNLTHGARSGRIHALIAVREATAYGILGDDSAFARSIASAWREMDRAAEFEALNDCPVWLQFMAHPEVQFQEARGYEDLGKPAQAVDLYADAADRQAGARNAANYRAHLAAALAGMGDTRNAVNEGLSVLEHLEGDVSSPRTLQDLTTVRNAVADDEFHQRYDQLVQHAG